MLSCCLSQIRVILVLLAICKLCIRFRWSLYLFRPKSSHLSSGMLDLPCYCHVHHFPSGARICIAYHTCFASCCLCISRGWLWFRLFVFLSWVEPGDEYVIEEPIEYVYEDQANLNSENFAGKITIPSKSLLSLFASCSLYCYAAIPTTCYIMPPLLPCQTSNPSCPSKPLIGYVTALLSPSYSVASCRWRLKAVPCWNIYLLVGISLYYLVILMHLYTW